MKYDNIKQAKFLSRPNRFIAHIEIDGKTEVCHVKNTGRCRELLTENATVFVQESDNPNRKTKYDLIAVMKGDRLINMDSQIPNKVFGEWAVHSGYFGNITLLKAEKTYCNSRFDYYIETDTDKIFVEVKGVTLEENGVVKFPDAPTERGVKHLNELCRCVSDGYKAYIFFIIQMDNVKYFTPNRDTHPQFADALVNAQKQGVQVVALDCKVTQNSISADNFVEIKL
ncbi:MAG: DNA/RNA nuclease SfsA [Oscillospiraceae bacterium]|nr:DNA/RNA nuclease SfsA [Oscillospiraceae bacterium]